MAEGKRGMTFIPFRYRCWLCRQIMSTKTGALGHMQRQHQIDGLPTSDQLAAAYREHQADKKMRAGNTEADWADILAEIKRAK